MWGGRLSLRSGGEATESARQTQGLAGADATLTCKPKRKKFKCRLAFAAVPDVTKVRISRRGVIYASGKPVGGPGGTLVLRFRRSDPLPSGRYVLTVIQGAGATRIITRSRLGVKLAV
jgi:hypothetical protein